MNNQTEREAFEVAITSLGKSAGQWIGDVYMNPYGQAAWLGFQAGAAYQRSIDKGLVEALEAAFDCGMVPTSTAKVGGATRHARQVVVADMLRDALAAFRAAQEGK